MAWKSTQSITQFKHWVYDSNSLGMTRTIINPITTTTRLIYESTTPIRFSSEKTYIFKTTVDNFSHLHNYKRLDIIGFGQSFSYFSASSTNFERSTLPVPGDDTNSPTLYYYVSPTPTQDLTTIVGYYATYNGFGTQSGPASPSNLPSVIQNLDLVEVDWKFQGWKIATSVSPASNARYEGWYFDDSSETFTFFHYTKSSSNRRLPSGGYTSSNYASKFVPYDEFNLEFYFDKTDPLATAFSFIDVYLTDNLPSTSQNLSTFTQSLYGQKIATISSDGTYSFYKLTGNKWLNFVANYSDTNNNYTLEISGLNIQGGYSQTDNNERFLFTNSNLYQEPTPLAVIGAAGDATYSIITTTRQTQHFTNSNYFGATGNPGFYSTIYGEVVNLSQQNSKIGNGTFKAGIWENGVWNSGWRVDEKVHDFIDIIASFPIKTKNNRWRIQISGNTHSVSQFEVGDRVAISNIVAIDINENRKLLKNYYTIVFKDSENLIVETDNNFPFRRIEKDSENHKIRITKNIWLNGGFLNGYFEGIWNDGLFKGYPFITEMYNSHWINGVFDGGHFNSFYMSFTFSDTLWTNGSVGLSFSSPHGFEQGDIVIIDKDDKSINPNYDGTASVVSIIDDYYIVTDLPWGSNSTLESGKIRKFTATGLIQNFKFYDNNVASKTSKQSQQLKDIWKFNSWIDVNFSTHSTTNINRQRIFYNEFPTSAIDFFANRKYGLGEFGALNLYGYITKDVLSSDSSFRDIDSFTKRKYSLGTKYEIFEDYLGDISNFNEPFGSGGILGGETNFSNNGWTYSYSGYYSPSSIPIPLTFSRTTDGTLYFEFANEASQGISLENTNITIPKNRYSIIEFDLIRQDAEFYNLFGVSPITLFNEPLFIGQDGNYIGNTAAFPVTERVNYYQTPDTRKVEYFYNRPGLDLGILSIGYFPLFMIQTFSGSMVELDNIKFYEVDSIPFFQYTNEDYVNVSVQVPYQGLAPFIDYSNANFSFVENITISLDSIVINASNTTVVQSSNTALVYSNPVLNTPSSASGTV